MTKTNKMALFEKGVEKDLAYRGAKVREMEIARAQGEARIQAWLDDRNVFLASLVDDHGFTVSEIGRILNTSNWKTANDAVTAGREIRRAAAALVPAEEIEETPAQMYRWDSEGERLTVTMPQSAFDPYLAMLARHPSPNGETWDFYLIDGKLLPAREDEDATWEQPVVQVVMTDQGKRDALAYIASQQREAA